MKLQKDIGREINIANLSSEEFRKKKKENDGFIRGVFKTKIIRLI